MSRILQASRFFILAVAFVGVMSGAGGLLGAIGAVVLALLGQAVLGAAEGVSVLLLTGAGLGATTAMLLGIFLMARNLSMPRLHSKVVSPAHGD